MEPRSQTGRRTHLVGGRQLAVVAWVTGCSVSVALLASRCISSTLALKALTALKALDTVERDVRKVAGLRPRSLGSVIALHSEYSTRTEQR